LIGRYCCRIVPGLWKKVVCGFWKRILWISWILLKLFGEVLVKEEFVDFAVACYCCCWFLLLASFLLRSENPVFLDEISGSFSRLFNS